MKEGGWDCKTRESPSVPFQLFALCVVLLCAYMLWSKEVHFITILRIDRIA